MITSASHQTASASRPSILFVGIGTPWLGGAGYLVRQDMLLDALTRLDANVTVALVDPEADAPPPPYPVHFIALPAADTRPESRWRSLWKDVTCRQPMLIRTLDCGALQAAMARVQPDAFDAVLAYRCDFAYATGVLNHRHLLLDIDDPEHLRRMDAARYTDDGNAAWQRRLDMRRLRDFELSCARQSQACFVCQDRDAAPFRSAGINPIVVPNCVNVGESCPDRSFTTSTLLFVGNMTGDATAPNVDAVRWLAKDIWPRVREKVAQARCIVAGPIRKRWREELEPIEGLEIRGFVEDLGLLLQQSAISLAPIRFGTGTRIKILDAMAAGCPVVSTTKGCEGLLVADESDIVIADSTENFAEACVKLLSDEERARRIGRAGWQTVFDRYNRQAQAHRLAEVLAGLTGAKVAQQRDLHSSMQQVQTTS